MYSEGWGIPWFSHCFPHNPEVGMVFGNRLTYTFNAGLESNFYEG